MVETAYEIFSWDTDVAKPQVGDISPPHAEKTVGPHDLKTL